MLIRFGDLCALVAEQPLAWQPPGAAVDGDVHPDAVAVRVVRLVVVGFSGDVDRVEAGRPIPLSGSRDAANAILGAPIIATLTHWEDGRDTQDP